MSLSTLPTPTSPPLVLFPDTLYDIPLSLMHPYKTIYIVEDPNYFTMWPFTKIKLAYMRACMQAYFKELVNKQKKKKKKTNVIYIESVGFPNFFNKLKECTMYYPNDLALKKRYEEKAKITYIYDCPNFLLSVDDELYKNEKTIKRHSAFYRRMKDKFNLLQSTKNQDKLNRSKPSQDYKVPVRPKYSSSSEYLNAAKYVFKKFSNNPGPHKSPEDLVKYLTYYPITRSQSAKHFKYFLDNYYSGFKFQDYIDKDEVFVNHSNISCVLNNGLLSAKNVIQDAYNYGKKKNIAINNIEGFIRQILGWREYMRYVYHIECNEMNMKQYNKIHSVRLTERFWNSSSNNLVVYEEYEKVMKYGYSHHIVRLMVFLNMMKLKNIQIEDIIEWFSCVHIDAYPWVMYSNVLAMGYYNKGYMSKAYVSSSNYIVKNSNYKKNGEWDKEWDRLYRIFVSKKI